MFFAFKCGKTGFFVAKNGKIQEISHSNAVQVSPLGPSKKPQYEVLWLDTAVFLFSRVQNGFAPFHLDARLQRFGVSGALFLALEGFFTFSQIKID